jgi:hypothetical protein
MLLGMSSDGLEYLYLIVKLIVKFHFTIIIEISGMQRLCKIRQLSKFNRIFDILCQWRTKKLIITVPF